jgi:hypothetical protein
MATQLLWRELMGRAAFSDAVRLRRCVYSADPDCIALGASGAVDAWDEQSTHFGVYLVRGSNEELVAVHRHQVGDQAGQRAPLTILNPARLCAPRGSSEHVELSSLQYTSEVGKEAMVRLLGRITGQGRRWVEGTMLAVDRERLPPCLPPTCLLKFLFFSTAAQAFLVDGRHDALTFVRESSTAFYRQILGFSVMEDTRVTLPNGTSAVYLHGQVEGLPGPVRARLERIAAEIVRTGSACLPVAA